MIESLSFYDGLVYGAVGSMVIASGTMLIIMILKDREKRIKREMREYTREYTRDNFKRK